MLDEVNEKVFLTGWVADSMNARWRDLGGTLLLALVRFGFDIDQALKQQVEFDLDSFERATGRVLLEIEKHEFRCVQLRANRWTYLGTGMTHPKFLDTLEYLSPEQRQRIEEIAPVFC